MLSINYNSASRNAVNQIGQAQTGIAKAMNALSTGNRINSAADDVAGSAMASRMQVQSNSLDTAVTNANMGVNLIQTMDGAMKETNALLQRMTKLTEMSKNEAYSTQDRDMMDQEFGALVNELDRNAQSANYNGISLINNPGNTAATSLFSADISKGITFNAKVTAVAANPAAKPPVVGVAAKDANNTLTFDVSTTAAPTATVPAPAAVSKSISVDFGDKSLSADQIVGAINAQLSAAHVNVKASINSEGHLTIDSGDRVDNEVFSKSEITNIAGDAVDATKGAVLGAGTTTAGKAGFSDITINVGSSGNKYDNIHLKTVDLSAKGLGLSGASLTNSNDLNKTLATLKAALDTVTEQRSHLGASQKRLTFASDNLQNVKNSTDASLSSIQDTDYAATTMQLAREKVLSSASQAMLGQSNQMQSQVTQLLK
ncbi:flagellin N-terminal helical domain-containing protein [Photobacterium toruni]|uniref:flagellin N-terminal helical domain-containing protein n=1 Tax=Photobacterium toruni TaxID=1935446 RepID=UPI00210FA8FD|nr:flagellin [Photobacterium toruni]